eukprot:symbB.v1.2.002650.t1/scaffold142.1/size299426/8
MLFEGTMLLVVGGACVRVWSMAANDLSTSCCRCCRCCGTVAVELRWWGSTLIFAGGLGLLALALATALNTDSLGSLVTELLALTLAGLLITGWSYKDLAARRPLNDRTQPLVGEGRSWSRDLASTFQDRPPGHHPSAPPLEPGFEPVAQQALQQAPQQM